MNNIAELIKIRINNKILNDLCPFCLSKCMFIQDKLLMRCNNRQCRKYHCLFNSEFVNSNRKKLPDLMVILELWTLGTRICVISKFLKFDYDTVKGYITMSLPILSKLLNQKTRKIGGYDKIVEIDESKFGKRKYNQGHRIVGTWVVGFVERTDERRIILVPVNKRDKITLHQLIKEYVNPGTTIITDEWRGYFGLEEYGYIHKTINHSVTYSRVENGLVIHTNTIEGNWRAIKDLCPSNYRTEELIMPYLQLYMLKRLFGDDLYKNLINILLE